jgi:hypothetical protein
LLLGGLVLTLLGLAGAVFAGMIYIFTGHPSSCALALGALALLAGVALLIQSQRG